MNKYKQVFVNLAILTYILSAGVTTAYAMPQEYNDDKEIKRSIILKAFDSGDYKLWKTIVGEESLIIDNIGRDSFMQFVKARNLARQGKYDDALLKTNELGKRLKLDSRLSLEGSCENDELRKINEYREKIDIIKKDIERLI